MSEEWTGVSRVLINTGHMADYPPIQVGLLYISVTFNWGIPTNNTYQASYKAFCRKNGSYYTTTIGSRSWNAELLGRMTVSMAEPWQGLQAMLAALDSELQNSVTMECRKMRNKLEGERSWSVSKKLYSYLSPAGKRAMVTLIRKCLLTGTKLLGLRLLSMLLSD